VAQNIKLTFVLLMIPTLAYSEPNRATEPLACSDIQQGGEVQRSTRTVRRTDGRAAAFATVTLNRDKDDTRAERCHVLYQFFVKRGTEPEREVKRLDEIRPNIVGATIIGFSPDESKIAADFWWGEGDYTAVRPVVHSIRTQKTHMRELGDQIIRQLPSCDYYESFERLTNPGEAVIHVPESHYVLTGCPDQGEWTFDPKSGRVRRIRAER
jgi:hypothetical protein